MILNCIPSIVLGKSGSVACSGRLAAKTLSRSDSCLYVLCLLRAVELEEKDSDDSSALRFLSAAIAIDSDLPSAYLFSLTAHRRLWQEKEATRDSIKFWKHGGSTSLRPDVTQTQPFGIATLDDLAYQVTNFVWNCELIPGPYDVGRIEISQEVTLLGPATLPMMGIFYLAPIASGANQLNEAIGQLGQWSRNLRDPACRDIQEGMFCLVHGDCTQAILHFDAASKKSSNLLEVFSGRGYAYFRCRNYEKALADLDTALSLRKDRPALHLFRADVLRQLGRKEEADRESRNATN